MQSTDLANKSGEACGASPGRLPGHGPPRFLALCQPFLWVETAGTAWLLAAIFMLSPPSICFRIGAVKTAGLANGMRNGAAR